MSNGAELCCILGLCCPPLQQRETVIKWYSGHGCSDSSARELADVFIDKMKPVRKLLKDAQAVSGGPAKE